jgi:hypothetical protein
MVSFKGAHCAQDVILTCVRWYLAYPLSYRQVEELVQGRGVSVDHAMVHRWVLQYSPQLEAVFHRRKRPAWLSWRMDETSLKVNGQWRFLSGSNPQDTPNAFSARMAPLPRTSGPDAPSSLHPSTARKWSRDFGHGGR